jgi:hypothetical protein
MAARSLDTQMPVEELGSLAIGVYPVVHLVGEYQ